MKNIDICYLTSCAFKYSSLRKPFKWSPKMFLLLLTAIFLCLYCLMILSFRPKIYAESETDQILNAKYFVWKKYSLGKWGLREAFNQNSLMQLFNGDRLIVHCLVEQRSLSFLRPEAFKYFLHKSRIYQAWWESDCMKGCFEHCECLCASLKSLWFWLSAPSVYVRAVSGHILIELCDAYPVTQGQPPFTPVSVCPYLPNWPSSSSSL